MRGANLNDLGHSWERCSRTIVMTFVFSMIVPFALCAELGGTVVDNVGAAQPRAKVVLQNSDNTLKRIEETGEDGKFRFVDLPAGKYKLSISCTCFKTFKRQIILENDSRPNLDINLKQADKRCMGID